MKKNLLGLCFVLMLTQTAQSQLNRYIIRLRHKGDSPFSISNPQAYLSAKAITRRTNYNISIDSTDLPVTPRFVDSIGAAGAVTILNVSKWLNSVTIRTTDAAAIAKINSFPFVQSATAIAAKLHSVSAEEADSDNSITTIQRSAKTAADFFNYGSSSNQIKMHNGQFLHNIGLRGQNMVIGVLDGGFQNYLTVKAFDSARTNAQILGVYDFVIKDSSVNEDDAHGMQCFSVIAANIPGQFVGTAPKANFYLFRSEDVTSEFPIEEHNWVCAAERLDSVGGDAISSSLGYSDGMTNASFNHTYAEMNGNTTMAAIGADLAAKKGILVMNAAGNQGNEAFKRISSPADGDSVLAVGAVNSAGLPAPFTSLGPSSDGQVKPDVASQGVATTLQLPNNTIGTRDGTSFATPNIAGLAVCLWQGFPGSNNMKIIYALRASGSRATNPNDTIGYGIPDVKKAMLFLLKDFSTATATIANCKTTINFTSKDLAGMNYEIERKLPGENIFSKLGQVAGSGNSFSNKSYAFTDSLINAQAGTISYRIRQVIDTAIAGFAADYIDTVNVTLSASCITTSIPGVAVNDNRLQLLPNPAYSFVTVRINTAQPIPQLQIKIFNSKGQQVARVQKNKAAGIADFTVSTALLASGQYFVSVYNGSTIISTKVLLKL
ncbi:MAG: S8 family peptidase [Bacteroidota bacterium]